MKKSFYNPEEDWERIKELENIYIQEKEEENAVWWQQYMKEQEGVVIEETKIPEKEQVLPF